MTGDVLDILQQPNCDEVLKLRVRLVKEGLNGGKQIRKFGCRSLGVFPDDVMGKVTHPQIPRRRSFLFPLLEELLPLRLEARNRRNYFLYVFLCSSHKVKRF